MGIDPVVFLMLLSSVTDVQLRPSFTMRGPSQTERGGGQVYAVPAVPLGGGGRTRASLASRVVPAPARGGGIQELA
jgi:hypothetical protein